jgi:lipid II:glycine glycyltransferase (peptidoglycan interpeptide bridge formation enzyme)
VPNQDIIIQTAFLEDKPVAGTISYVFKDAVYLSFNGSLSKYLYLHPNELLYWNLIELASDSGYKRVNFGSTSVRSTEGHYRFKSHFGMSAVRYNDYSLYRFQIHRLFVDGLTQMAWRTGLGRVLPYTIKQQIEL